MMPFSDIAAHLRACYPADFCNIMQSVGEYESRPMKVTPAELDRAAALYFTKTKKFTDCATIASRTLSAPPRLFR